MIEFGGELSKEVLEKLIKREYLNYTIIGFISAGIPAIPIILLGIFASPLVFLLLIIVVICFIDIIIGTKVNVTRFGQTQVKIEQNEIEIIRICTNEATCRTFDDINKILDYGDYYRIVFYVLSKKVLCICEKSLIKQGTIEEFEELFKDYIVRK
jgi:hypothetical protein